MADFVQHNHALADQLPESVRSLGANRPFLFSSISREAAERCLRLRVLLPYSGLVLDPAFRPLGDPALQTKRLTTPLPAGCGGCQEMVADLLSFTYTPRTAVAYGSCGPTPAPGAHPFKADDLVITALPLARLLESDMSAVFCDRQPIRTDVEATDAPQLDRVPWDCIRDSKFGPRATFDERLRYHAEVLVRGPMPVTMLTWAVPTEAAADALLAQAQAFGLNNLTVVVRRKLFF